MFSTAEKNMQLIQGRRAAQTPFGQPHFARCRTGYVREGTLSGERVERRLAAILAADLAGYSRLMGADEEGTARRLREHRSALEPLVVRHGGRIVKTTGDGMLIEFGSVVGAVQCAIALQQLTAEREARVPEDRRLRLRIGVHLGDVLIEGDDILGDGVNIAARLEGIAEPDGICISGDAFRQVQGKVDAEFADIGEPQLKNIARPVRVYQARKSRAAGTAAAPALTLPDKPSVAVLPFANMSSDPEQEFLADGIAEDVITALSRYPSLFVIARNSTFTYKGRAIDVREVGRELGVRYVLEGSLRKAGSRIRVTAQMVEAETGNHVWAERYDRDLADIFAMQDEISQAVTVAVAPTVDGAERRRALRRPPENLDAWTAYQQGLWHLGKVTAEANDQARVIFERSIELDPAFAPAYAGLSLAHGYACVHYRTIPLDEGLPRNLHFARKAVELDPMDAHALAASSISSIWHGDLEAALASAQRTIALSPGFAHGHAWLGAALIFMGRHAEGRVAMAVALQLNPSDHQMVSDVHHVLAQSYYFDRDYERCVAVCRQQLKAFPGISLLYGLLAAALAQLGRIEEAQSVLAALKKAGGSIRNHRRPYHRLEDHELRLEGLRKAGWEE
jgi:adenylate cyclase